MHGVAVFVDALPAPPGAMVCCRACWRTRRQVPWAPAAPCGVLALTRTTPETPPCRYCCVQAGTHALPKPIMRTTCRLYTHAPTHHRCRRRPWLRRPCGSLRCCSRTTTPTWQPQHGAWGWEGRGRRCWVGRTRQRRRRGRMIQQRGAFDHRRSRRGLAASPPVLSRYDERCVCWYRVYDVSSRMLQRWLHGSRRLMVWNKATPRWRTRFDGTFGMLHDLAGIAAGTPITAGCRGCTQSNSGCRGKMWCCARSSREEEGSF